MELQGKDDTDVRKVIFVGLDNAGKTSIILSLLREISKFAIIKPTRNAERRTFEFLGMNISEWDLGGHEPVVAWHSSASPHQVHGRRNSRHSCLHWLGN